MSKDGKRHIVAMGGGGFSMEPRGSSLDEFVLSLTGSHRPRVCFLPTATGDSERYIRRFYTSMSSRRCRASHLSLFLRDTADPGELLLRQDVIYVGGGNTANMLAVWRLHGVDRALREAWRRGVVLCGVSAGANCWFEACSTDSFGPLAPLADGLGLLAGSVCPHYDAEKLRRPTFRRWVASGRLPAGFALDNFAAAHFIGKRFVEAVSSRRGAQAWRVRRRGGRAVEQALDTRYLGR